MKMCMRGEDYLRIAKILAILTRPKAPIAVWTIAAQELAPQGI